MNEYTIAFYLSRKICNRILLGIMATKNIDFTDRLEKRLSEMGVDKKIFCKDAEINYSTFMTYLAPGSRGRVPEWDQLVKIANASGKSIDWLLTGKESRRDHAHPCAGLEEYCKKIKNIILSQHPVITPAFLANIAAFDYSIGQDEKTKDHSKIIKRMKKRINDLEEAVSRDQSSGIDEVASSNTGKRET